MWVLGTKTRSSARAASAISLAPNKYTFYQDLKREIYLDLPELFSDRSKIQMSRGVKGGAEYQPIRTVQTWLLPHPSGISSCISSFTQLLERRLTQN